MSASSNSSGSKPTPVREILPDEGGASPNLTFRRRAFTSRDGGRWEAEELGWTRSGRREDPGAMLLLLGFRAVTEEDEEASLTREALVVAESLEDLESTRLADLLESAGPYREISDDKPFFGGTSRGKGGSRRRGGARGRRDRS